METFVSPKWLMICLAIFSALSVVTNCIDIYYDWDVSFDHNLKPLGSSQSVITINGLFPGPLINGTTNDNINVNVHNNLDEPLLMTWNGIQQRLNSWQDGVSGTNCPIMPGQNWTYNFQMKDQIGSYSYFPSTNYLKAGGGFGPIRVNNRNVISVPFPQPEGEFDFIVNDWFKSDYKDLRSSQETSIPDAILINGQGHSGGAIKSKAIFVVTQGKTYRFRISNLGSMLSINFRIENHKMILVETEGSYTNQITIDSLDVHVGQSYSVLITADQDVSQYYIVASPKFVTTDVNSPLVAKVTLAYDDSKTSSNGPLPSGPDPFDKDFSVNQAKSIRMNLTTGAARPNPQGSFSVRGKTLSQTFILYGSKAEIDGQDRFAINNVSYLTPSTPLKLADYYVNGSGVYQLDAFPVQPTNDDPIYGTFVVTGQHKGWLEIVIHNEIDTNIASWHLDGYGFYVVGFGDGEWTTKARSEYNLDDPVYRSTFQVYPRGWTAVYVYLDNPGMWNLRSQILKNWYLGQELYIRVFDSEPNSAKERPPPHNLLLCGIFDKAQSPFASPVYVPAPGEAEAPQFPPVPPPIPSAIAPAPESDWW